MKGGVYLDTEVESQVQQQFALVQATRGKRKRFPETCIEVVASAEEALQRAVPGDNLHAAEVMGPSRSSEGIRLYYLVRWLSEEISA
jgi:hypothetical protein